ncbi:hypothetical protein WDU94_000990 [Cyamophila willieti]
MQAIQKLGLLDMREHPALHPSGPEICWRELVCTLLGLSTSDIFYENLKNIIADKVGNTGLEALESLGLLNDELMVAKQKTPLDTLSNFLRNKLVLEQGDRDVIVLRHDIDILWPNRSRERKSISLVVYGEPDGTTAMARTVGLPAAIAAKMVLEGEIQTRGTVLPLTPDVYRPLLLRLKEEGIVAREQTFSLD